MLADYAFYKNEYKGIVIPSANDYDFFAERASDELALYINRVPRETIAQSQLKKCACRIADILYGKFKQTKDGVGGIASESVGGYYSVSYTQADEEQIKKMIYNAIVLYIGRFVLKPIKVIY